MSAEKHILIVKSSAPPIIEMDVECGSVYIRFKKTKVAKTLEQCITGPVVTVDLDKSGDVVGIEALCWDEFEIGAILKKAHVCASSVDFTKAKFRPAPRYAEETEEAFA